MGTNLKFVKHLLVPDSVEPPSSVQTKLNSQNPEMPSGCLGVSRGQLAGSLAKEMTNPWVSETVFVENSMSLQIWGKKNLRPLEKGSHCSANPSTPDLVKRNYTIPFPMNGSLGVDFMSVTLKRLRQGDFCEFDGPHTERTCLNSSTLPQNETA